MLGRLVHQINTAPLWFFIYRAKTILDVGCGVNSPVNYFVRKDQIMDGLDISPMAISAQQQTKYRRVICQDIHDFQPEQAYDTITALDFIEHLPKEKGYEFLARMEKMARRVIIVTPNGFIPQAPQPDNPFQEHLSGWSTDDFQKRGYRVYGMFGPQWLREGTAVLRFRPKFLWAIIDWLLLPISFWLPRHAFSLLAVYDDHSRPGLSSEST